IGHQLFNHNVERARYNHLSKPQTARFGNQFESTRKDRRFQHVFKQLVGKITKSVFGFAFITFEEEIVEYLATVLIGGDEYGNAQNGGRSLCDALPQPLLIFRQEVEGMHKIGAYQRSLQIVECCGNHRSSSIGLQISTEGYLFI